MEDAVKKGYLVEDYRLFHLCDSLAQMVEPHFHEFDKFVLVCGGSVEYTVEGVCNRMQAGDMLFVRHHDIHRPVISSGAPYERYVLWVSPEFLERCSISGTDLSACFSVCAQQRSFLIRPNPELERKIRKELKELETAVQEDAFGRDILTDACIRRLLVTLNRCVLAGAAKAPREVDPKMDEVLRYINEHLTEELSVEKLSALCYLSRYYFMRRFKETTGYTVHGYIMQKRLAAAAERLDSGENATVAAMEAGFPEYSTFLRAFRRAFDLSPSEYLRRQKRMDSSFRE